MPAPSSLLLAVSLVVVVVSLFVVVESSLVLLLAVSFPSSSLCRFPRPPLPPSRCIPPPPPPPRRCIHSSVPSLHIPSSCSLACRSLLSLYPLLPPPSRRFSPSRRVASSFFVVVSPSPSSSCHSLPRPTPRTCCRWAAFVRFERLGRGRMCSG
jgi:hypothetical protein